jgi:uncharacterized membrane protein YkoI
MPQPIDLQTELGRATAAERIQAVADRASLAAQQRTAEETAKERLRHEAQVQQTDQAEEAQVDPDGSHGDSRRDQNAKRRATDAGEGPKEERGPLEDGQGGQIDLSV